MSSRRRKRITSSAYRRCLPLLAALLILPGAATANVMTFNDMITGQADYTEDGFRATLGAA